MEHLSGSQHPALLSKKCTECNFLLKNQFHPSGDETLPYWTLFCPNFSCPKFGDPQIIYEFETDNRPTVVDDKLIHDTKPDTSIESD